MKTSTRFVYVSERVVSFFGRDKSILNHVYPHPTPASLNRLSDMTYGLSTVRPNRIRMITTGGEVTVCMDFD